MRPPRNPTETLEALADIEREMVAVLNPEELLRVMVARAKQLFGGDCGIHLVAPSGWLVPRIDTDPAAMARRVAMGEGVLGRCAQSRRGALVNDYPDRAEAIPWAVALGLQHVVAEPLLVRDELLGVIVVSRRGPTAPPFRQDDADALKHFAGLAALALNNATLYEDARRQRHDAEVLARLAGDLNRSLDLDTVLERVVAGARDLCTSDLAAVALRDIDAPTTFRFGPGSREVWRGRAIRPEQGPGAIALLSGEPFTTTDVRADSRIGLDHRARIAAEGIVALAVVPIRREDHVQGLLYACHRTTRPFSEDDVRRLCLLADHASIAIHNAQLYAERVGALAALRESEQRYRLLAENMVDVVTLFDMNLTPVYVSPSVTRLRGYTPEEAMTQTSEERFTPASLQLAREVLREELTLEASGEGDRGRSRTIELELRRKDGTTVWVETTTTFVRDETGCAIGIASVTRNIDARKRAEIALGEREAQLLQAQKMEAVGRLAGGIAHDFNNILTVIGGRAQLLLGTLDVSAPGRHGVEMIQQAAERAAKLTRQLLAFSRKQLLQPSTLDLTAVVTGLTPMLRRLIGEHIQLTVAPGATGWVRADATQLEQVIANLTINAQDAMPDGGRITIETADADLDAAFAAAHPGARPGPHVRLSVQDTGHGMDADTRAKAFEPFFTTKEPGKGTGLGLSMVYGIVKQHDGYVTVESEPGQGSTFSIFFPRVEGVPAGTEPPAPAPPSTRGVERILLVEDEAAVRAIAQESLASHGYTVLEAHDVDDALRIAQEDTGPIDLLVTDVVMPVMNGRHLAERIQRRHPETRVLYMSGYTDDAIVRHGVLEPGAAFLQKPFTPRELAGRVRELLDGHGCERQDRPAR